MTQRSSRGGARISHANKLILDRFNHWQGWRCMAGIERFASSRTAASIAASAGLAGVSGG